MKEEVALIFICSLSCISLLVLATDNNSTPDYWIKRRAEFSKNTTFELTESNKALLGGKFSSWLLHTGHLPFWFDFELFKFVFKKSYSSPSEELARNEVYIKTCVRTLKQRVLYRILAGTNDTKITSDADKVST